MTGQEQHDLTAAEYVLGLTDDETRHRLDKRLNDDSVFAAEVLHWQKAFSGIDLLTHAVIPPSAVWQQIEQDLGPNTGVSGTTSIRRHPGFWLGWGLAAAMAGILIFTHLSNPDAPQSLQLIAVLSGAQPDAQFVVNLDKSASLLQVSALNITLPENKNLQLWLIRGSAAPQSLGLINHRDSNVFRLPPGELDNQTVLAVSLEPVGGSRLSGPSGPVIFQGKVTLL
ncbi:anti-sigma factor [Pantoea agglomerans]|jgi:anti-sigma-K factor RskA|uniref:anti-sigma factor n=1 Tax=Enterobacter agglomerans TaxID=549 RepID=UPI00044595DE|nr:anti-sigma factor [Pantoea agglomerans]EZI33176.1 Anti-sigma K factor RskA [Pantoea agglomerans]MVT81132.1 anti-sigma factor [Pantoea agglomerans]